MSERPNDPWSTPAAPRAAKGEEAPLAPLPEERHLRPGGRTLPRLAWFAWFVFVFVLAFARSIDGMQLLLLGAGGPAVVVVLVVLRILLLSDRLNALNNQALQALNEERVDLAVERFEALVRASKGSGIHMQVALHNLALAELCRARWDRALSLLASVEKLHHRSVLRAQVAQSSAALIALTHALRGDLGAARAWLKAGEKRKDVPTAVGLEILAEAIVHARAGNHDSAERLVAHRWRTASSALSGRFLGALRFVWAYAARETGRPPEVIRDLVLGARPYPAASFDFLFLAWPELRELVERESSELDRASA